MVAVVATWLLAAMVVVGLGIPISSRLTRHGPTAIRTALWIGVFLAGVALALVNLLEPLRSPIVSLGIIGLALLGAVVSLPTVRALRWPTSTPSPSWIVGAVAIGIAGAIGWMVAATRAPSNYDTGLYHLGAIEYAAQAATVPGLANLFAPLGYGNLMVPTAAAFTNGPLGDSGFLAVNSFLLLLLPADLALRSLGRRTATVGARVLFISILAIFPPMLWMADAWVISPTSDTAVLALTVIGVAGLADVVWRGRCSRIAAIQVLAPLSLAAAMRPQAWLMVTLVLLVLVSVQWRKDREFLPVLGSLWPVLLFPVSAAVVGAARDMLLSGWWLYPLDRFPLPVSWRAEDPSPLLALTLGIARDPGPAYQQAATGYGWIPGWLARLPSAWEPWLLAGMVVLGLVLLLLDRSTARWKGLALALTPGVVATSAWFLVSPPSFRFGWGPLFSTAVLILGWAWASSRWSAGRALGPVVGLGTAGVVITTVLVLTVRLPTWPEQPPDVTTNPVSMESGLIVSVPAPTDQCWNAFPLCTPTPATGLALRGTEWREGFSRGSDAGERS